MVPKLLCISLFLVKRNVFVGTDEVVVYVSRVVTARHPYDGTSGHGSEPEQDGQSRNIARSASVRVTSAVKEK